MCKVSKCVCVSVLWQHGMHESMHACLCMCTFLFGLVWLPFSPGLLYLATSNKSVFSHTHTKFPFSFPHINLSFAPSPLSPPPKPPNKCRPHCPFWKIKSTLCFRGDFSSSPHMTCVSLPPVSVSPSMLPFRTHLCSIYLPRVPVFIIIIMHSSHSPLIRGYRLAACAYHTYRTLCIQQVDDFTRLSEQPGKVQCATVHQCEATVFLMVDLINVVTSFYR